MQKWEFLSKALKKVLYRTCLAGFLVLSVCCFPGNIFDLSSEEKGGNSKPVTVNLEYLEHVKAQPLDFQIPASEDAKAWARARRVLKKYGKEERWGSRILRISTDDVLEIDVSTQHSDTFEDIGFLFRIVRAPRGNTINYTVSYAPLAEHSDGPPIKALAQAIAYYLVSGTLMDFYLIKEFPPI